MAVPSGAAFSRQQPRGNMLTASRLRYLLSYNKSTGIMRWKNPTSHRVRVGSLAGCSRSDEFRKIAIDGKSYLSNRLAVKHVTGKWPAHAVTLRNGDRADVSWRNIRVA